MPNKTVNSDLSVTPHFIIQNPDGTTSTGQKVQGSAADGAAVAGNPVLIAGQDGTNAQSLLTDTTGRLLVVADGVADAVVTTASASSATTILSLDTTGYGALSWHYTSVGTSCVVSFEGSNDNSNWVAASSNRQETTGSESSSGTASLTAAYVARCTFKYHRLRISSYGSGTVTAVAALRKIDPGPPNISLRTSTQAVGTVQELPIATGGLSIYRAIAGASTNAANIKNGAGMVYAIQVTNAAAYAVFVKLYNKASSPAVGTDVPVMTIGVPANSALPWALPIGLAFATGISIAMTKLVADADTTVLVANDCVVNIGYF